MQSGITDKKLKYFIFKVVSSVTESRLIWSDLFTPQAGWISDLRGQAQTDALTLQASMWMASWIKMILFVASKKNDCLLPPGFQTEPQKSFLWTGSLKKKKEDKTISGLIKARWLWQLLLYKLHKMLIWTRWSNSPMQLFSKLDFRIRDDNWAVFFDLDTSRGTKTSTGWLLAKCFNYTPKALDSPQNKHGAWECYCLPLTL